MGRSHLSDSVDTERRPPKKAFSTPFKEKGLKKASRPVFELTVAATDYDRQYVTSFPKQFKTTSLIMFSSLVWTASSKTPKS